VGEDDTLVPADLSAGLVITAHTVAGLTCSRHIAMMSMIYHSRRRKMMIAYDEFPDRVEIVTIHPIKSRQIRERVLAGRWTHE